MSVVPARGRQREEDWGQAHLLCNEIEASLGYVRVWNGGETTVKIIATPFLFPEGESK